MEIEGEMREAGSCAYWKSLGRLSLVIQRLQSREKLDRRRVHKDKTLKWAEKSVWTEVTAKDLGLIVKPVVLTTNCPKISETIVKKFHTARKLSTSRGIEKKPIFHKLQQNQNSSTIPVHKKKTITAKKLPEKSKFHENHNALASTSNFLPKFNELSSELHEDMENSIKTEKSLVYNHFNVFRAPTEDSKIFKYNPRKDNETEESRELQNISASCQSTKSNETGNEEKTKESKTTRLIREIRKISTKRLHSKSRDNKKVSSKPNNDENTNGIIEKSNLIEATRQNREITRIHREKSPARIDMKKFHKRATKNYEKLRQAISMSKKAKMMPKNDYEDSDIDESLLVDPSTDIPQSLVDETIDDNIELSNEEFDFSRELHFTSNSPLSNISTVESSSEINTNCQNKNILGILKRKSDKIVKFKKKVRFASGTNKEKSTIFINKVAIKPEMRENMIEQIQNHENCDKTISPTLGRVTRLSLKNSLAMRERDVNWPIGTIVWGNCMGWWPGFIVDPGDIGMIEKPEKSWICWIGEYKISHLRDKTQIQKFSTKLRERMIVTLGSKDSRDPSYRACLETLRLIASEISFIDRLTKPHDVWAENVLLRLKTLDSLILYPYPSSVKPRLDKLRETNVRAREKYLSESRANAEKSLMKNSTISSKATTRETFVSMPGNLPLNEQKPGVITWSKIMGQQWWPAVIIDYRDWGMKEPIFGCQWIIWYGDYTLSQVNHRFFLSFDHGIRLMREYTKNCKRQCYRSAVIDSSKDYYSRLGYKTDDWQIDDVFALFDSDEEKSTVKLSTKNNGETVLPEILSNFDKTWKYPSRIVEILRNHRGNSTTVAAAREYTIKTSENIRQVESCKRKIDELCLMCLKFCKNDDTSIEHPFFIGKLCNDCREKYEPTIFAYGDDGKCFFCTVCAGSDTVVICDETICPRVYCTACIKYLIAPLIYDDIMLKDPWFCFICENNEKSTKGSLLKSRKDWKTRVSRLFRTKNDSILDHMERRFSKNNEKPKIRVLSLFDGISAGFVVLKNLGIQIDCYYASEIDPDAEMISSAHYGHVIKRLGDVRLINEETIRKIGPIDLLIGGSPCNDLSLVNPLRLGLHDPNGTGILVFEYCRVKKLLERQNQRECKEFFWLFENVASMPAKYRSEINKHLGREPELIDSANYSPQHRPRLYWSNLPVVSFPLSTQDLQDVLTPNCNRYALVKKIRTVTTCVNSLKQGRDALKPILMNDVNDTLWITELEEIFGFPRHYTDVKNLCATKRQKVIAMSWSVQTIMEIMRPLCNFFYTRNDESA